MDMPIILYVIHNKKPQLSYIFKMFKVYIYIVMG